MKLSKEINILDLGIAGIICNGYANIVTFVQWFFFLNKLTSKSALSSPYLASGLAYPKAILLVLISLMGTVQKPWGALWFKNILQAEFVHTFSRTADFLLEPMLVENLNLTCKNNTETKERLLLEPQLVYSLLETWVDKITEYKGRNTTVVHITGNSSLWKTLCCDDVVYSIIQ